MERPARTSSDELPAGTVIFLRSDIEGSMDLLRALGARYDEVNLQHGAIMREAIASHDGRIVRTEGDAFFVVFTDAGSAARTAVDVQRGMAAHEWPSGHEVKVRVGLHAGSAYRAGDDYGGFEVNRAARIAALGWGGQIVLSDAVRGLLGADVSGEWSLRDLGPHHLKGVIEPERIYQLVVAGLPSTFPPLRSGTTNLDRLPRRMTTFVGRERELQELLDLLSDTRLLTLTGPGGTGKTRLAVELARRRAQRYEDGAWFVDLQAIREPAAISGEVARSLGLFDGAAGPAVDRLLDYVTDRSLLIVIDNFEQVIGGADVVRDILDASVSSRIIVTSRVPLRLSAEQEYRVGPLELAQVDGADASEAVRLFIERARRVRPDLHLGDDERETIHSTCQLLDGLPLAIELCAARTSAIPVHIIHQRLVERLPLPDAGPRDLPERQRTIESTVSWSYELLDRPLQSLFAQLAVFEQTFDLEQAQEVCGPAEKLGIDVFMGLFGLVEHSLLNRVDDSAGGIRFGMLETMRAFARSLPEDHAGRTALGRRHAVSYGALAEREGGRLPGVELARGIDRLEPDAENLLAAARFSVDAGDVETALRLVGNLWRFWVQTGRLVEGRILIDAALSLPGAETPSPLRIRALDAAGGIAYWSGDIAHATSLYQEQATLAGRLDDPESRLLAAFNVYSTRFYGGEATEAETAGGEAARETFESAVRTASDPAWATVLDEMRAMAVFLPMVANDQPLTREGEAVLARCEASGEPRLEKVAHAARALQAFRIGDGAAACSSLATAVRIDLVLHETANAVTDLYLVQGAMIATSLVEVATVIEGALRAAFERLGIRPPMAATESGATQHADIMVDALGHDRYEAAINRGSHMSLDEVVDYLAAVGQDPRAHGVT